MVLGVPPASDYDIQWTESLSALGPLLCLYPQSEPDVLSALSIASRMRVSVHIDVHGPCESLTFFDECWQPCWRIYRLPDSDADAWEQLLADCLADPLAEVPTTQPRCPNAAVQRHHGQPIWLACPLALQSFRSDAGAPRLAATQPPLSTQAERVARNLVRRNGAQWSSPY